MYSAIYSADSVMSNHIKYKIKHLLKSFQSSRLTIIPAIPCAHIASDTSLGVFIWSFKMKLVERFWMGPSR